MDDAILVLNAGSSSVKFALFGAGTLEPLCRGGIEGIGSRASFGGAKGPEAHLFDGVELPETSNHEAATRWLLDGIRRSDRLSLRAAGHRVVHGGPDFSAPVGIDDAVMAALDKLIPLAPAHQPHNLAAIRAVAKAWPGLPQVACFDTAFHRSMPRLAQIFAIPHELTDQGLVRYGFHGLSYQHVADVLPGIAGEAAMGRVIVCHLGHGASLCAMHEGRSIATTMGFTALDGLMMGMRCGAIDAGLVLHLIEQRGMAPAEVSEILNRRSGLLGVSGISNDARTLLASDEPRAREALDLFAYRVVREAGSLMAALGGLDALVFTAGIGERSAVIRSGICRGLAWAGVALDETRNAANETRISEDAARIPVYVVAADEERPIARAVLQQQKC
ncbi:acetate/propionate family kinase [Methylobacterium gnaphalii]|uniref:Acetate kinase n=1 Tax=Methylobacterium gnaphalii TaxID=1010610 RepID=A0A512JGT4_9HYPH|nr:acetate/propionate family kinase [Methylobacterium gnaphalii]GEP09062.1 acetate kinase [Methylobacterium gnaphalii]GJD68374.1 Acetate kinase [Methylobacterium gnaphalii]GLS48986.1 acetate kinase [Methylobacterium gnaphalii]